MEPVSKPFRCSLCDLAFAFETSLSSHKVIEHHEEPPHVCSVCELAFFSAGIFASHLIKHSLERKKSTGFECCVCAVEFPSLQGIRVHMSHHTGATLASKGRPPQKSKKFFKCDQCTSMFWEEEKLKEHAKIHGSAGAKILECGTAV
ncbi:hypothetical protein BaRGS_00028522 [Batillaria attramentaria]|uniref:C2H2-type domain-containing protein n=1 Tax=Batillaria attramentaria TaxID=370345 RepID=A0ABD0JYW3_9CAEN